LSGFTAEFTEKLAANLASVRARIDAAATGAGRSAAEVTLVAVTKYVDPTVADALVDAGCQDLGESRPQELWHKVDACRNQNLRWHLIGPLQRNKVRRTLPLVALIHSVDSLRLLQEIDRESAVLGRPTPVLFEVNISGDVTKHGFQPEAMEAALKVAAECRHVEVRGLMGMASREGDLTAARHNFRRLRELRDQLRDRHCVIRLEELSMGMSGDFEAAIAEGATFVRIGSLLFEGLPQ
jgi:pyridoxal phosphate enzyme (YggS family)